MKEQVFYGTVFQNEHPELFDRLIGICPEGKVGDQGHGFRISIYKNDPRCQMIWNTFEQIGFKPWIEHWRKRNNSNEYTVTITREYDREDFNSIELFELDPPFESDHHEGIIRDRKGRIIVYHPTISKGKWDFRLSMYVWCLVSDRVKKLIEAAGLKSVKFKPTVVVKGRLYDPTSKHYSWKEAGGEPWWELDSNRSMPGLSPSMELRNADGKRVDPSQYKKGLNFYEGLYTKPELHYRASDLKGLDSFDLARTKESFGQARRHVRDLWKLVASRRFYEFCVRNNLKINWVPVRIDPD